jgi:hypothetical protein
MLGVEDGSFLPFHLAQPGELRRCAIGEPLARTGELTMQRVIGVLGPVVDEQPVDLVSV